MILTIYDLWIEILDGNCAFSIPKSLYDTDAARSAIHEVGYATTNRYGSSDIYLYKPSESLANNYNELDDAINKNKSGFIAKELLANKSVIKLLEKSEYEVFISKLGVNIIAKNN